MLAKGMRLEFCPWCRILKGKEQGWLQHRCRLILRAHAVAKYLCICILHTPPWSTSEQLEIFGDEQHTFVIPEQKAA